MNRMPLFLLTLAAMPAAAADYVWANLTGTGTSLAWTSAANWINADGTDASSYPKNESDTALFHGCSAGRVNPPWGAVAGNVRLESGYTAWNNSAPKLTSFSCAPWASFSWQCESKNNPWWDFPGLSEADNIDGLYPNATGMQNSQHKFFCLVSGAKPVWAGDGASYEAHPTNRTDMLYNAGTWPFTLTVEGDSHCGLVCWKSDSGTLSFSSDATLEIGSGMLIGGGNDWKWMSIGDPGSDGLKPAGAIRVPDGHGLWFWGDKHWILRSRVDAAALVVTRKQSVALVGDHSDDTCDYRVVCGTLQLGGDLPVTSSNSRSPWFVGHPSGVEAKGGEGDYVVEWAGTLVVGVRDAIPKSASVFLPGAYDRPTRTRLHGKIQLDADARCAALVIDGKNAQSGTWGSSQSAAEHKDDAVFSGAGVLTVGSAGTVLLVR